MRSLAVFIVVGLLATACGSAASEQPAILAAPSATTTPTTVPAAPSPTASASGVTPASAGVVPEAGVVYVWGSDDGIYRYDGATGALTRVWGASIMTRESAYGPYVLGRHGGTTLLKWDGATQQVCAGGNWSDFSTRQSCAYSGAGADRAVYTDSPEGGNGAALPRMLLPADWGAGTFAWDLNGLELAIVRADARPEPVRQHSTLWVMDLRHGTLRKVFDSASATSYLSSLSWSGRRISFMEIDSTSASASADGVNLHLWVLDVDSGRTVDLGHVLHPGWWSPDGRLAFVRGGDRFTWTKKELAVLDQDWNVTVVAGGGATIALAPAWQPVYRGARLAWIDAPDTTECCQRYVAGLGPSAQRVAVLDTGAGRARVTCPGMVTEGVRWSADGRSVLLLCRAPGVEYHALQVWYAPIGGALGDLAFGYYGSQPSLLSMTAWSLADR